LYFSFDVIVCHVAVMLRILILALPVLWGNADDCPALVVLKANTPLRNVPEPSGSCRSSSVKAINQSPIKTTQRLWLTLTGMHIAKPGTVTDASFISTIFPLGEIVTTGPYDASMFLALLISSSSLFF